MKKFIVVSLIILVIAGVGYAVWRKMRAGTPANANEIGVRTQVVVRGDLTETINAAGDVEPKTKVSISARVAARIAAIPFVEGDDVTKGKPDAHPPVLPSILVQLDDKDLQAALKQSEANYEAKTAQIVESKAHLAAQQASIEESHVLYADAQRDLGRQRQLLTTQDVSQSQVDAAQTKVDQVHAQLDAARRNLEAQQADLVVQQHEQEAAEAEISAAKENLSYATIVSPIDGTVTRVNAEPGELVVTGTMNNAGTVIMEVADLSQMLVNARIEEADVTKVQVGQKAKVRILAYADQVFEGVVRAVALAQTDEKDGTKDYKAEVLLDTKGKRIPSGLSADVEIATAHHKNITKVPSQAVVGRPLDDLPADLRKSPLVDKTKTVATIVFVVKDGKATAVPVKIGASDITDTIVESGLAGGERVIIGPYTVLGTIANGQAVKETK
ncbi:MAG TPA: efflux RND transporter periplasmic adaptor subunit [Tepidisphaeraceae bacterium]